MERFRIEFEKLHRALKKSHENESRLIKACKKLNDAIVQDAKKIQNAAKNSEKDNEYIKSLKSQLDSAYKIIETVKEKEEKNKQTITDLK